jgi:hypothetical protein
MKRHKHVEIYLLFEYLQPSEVVKLGYKPGTVYKYFKEYQQAKDKVKEMVLKSATNV